ncbi:MAG TPA: hypothetical protein VMU49_00560 [Candidatus Acidoferrales bacterium]|nr:hypothetical protein [Candidatus Acidoferrales bacterium]
MLPFAVSGVLSRRLPGTTTNLETARIVEYEQLLQQHQWALEDVERIVTADAERSSSLEDKATSVLGGLSVVAAGLGIVEAIGWPVMNDTQRILLIVAIAYALVALFNTLQAVRPKVLYLFNHVDLVDLLRRSATEPRRQWFGRPSRQSSGQARVRVAAMRLAYVVANQSARRRLSNTVEASLTGARNSIVLASAAALTHVAPMLWSRIWP